MDMASGNTLSLVRYLISIVVLPLLNVCSFTIKEKKFMKKKKLKAVKRKGLQKKKGEGLNLRSPYLLCAHQQ